LILGPAAELAPGTVLAGKYRILEVLGRGGMGIVYKAEDTKLHRSVALKFLSPERLPTQEARERFLVEARAAAALSHPNICTIHEIHDEEDKPFIEMEYVKGQSLKARIREHPLAASEAVELAIQVAEALEEAHQKGVIHRDIKSANIMVTDKGQAKVMDFGLAKVRGETLHTREGTTLGTVAYMSPEQAQGEHIDQRTDIWSLGVVLYEMLSGRLPFTGDMAASILYSVVHGEPKPLKEAQPGLPAELQQIVNRALKKELKARYASTAEMAGDLKRYRDGLKAQELSVLTPRTVLRTLRKPRFAIPVVACLLALGGATGWFFHRQGKIRWAREQALPEVESLVLATELRPVNLSGAYKLASEAEKYIPGDPALSALLDRCSGYISVKTQPAGAAVYVKEVTALDQEWKYLGTSPIERTRLPFGIFWWKLEKQGYETVMAVAPTYRLDLSSRQLRLPNDFSRVLDPKGKVPPNMVRVQGAQTTAGQLDDFFIDRYEVTNRQYKEFVDQGGYRERKYWKHSFISDGKVLSWEDAMGKFLDQTGRPGPSTWQAGDYSKGQADSPVSGVSWYEAAAYAQYAGKSLPTATHWAVARGPVSGWLSQSSNFKSEGPAPVGSNPSMTAYGAYDMAGNVREWCWNETKSGRLVRGGAWNDATYMMDELSQAPAFDRSPKNGFRCALYPDPGKIPATAFAPIEVATRDFTKQKPIPDSVFQVYKDQFSYDKKDLNPHVEWRNETSGDWIQEKVTVDAAYGNEKLPLYLFIPKGSSPPYQTVVYFPGSGSMDQPSSNGLERYWEFEVRLSFLPKNGRVVVYPIYKGTFERRDDALAAISEGAPTRQYTDYLIQLVKDLKRSVDYLETRSDIDSKKLAYLGFSWGGLVAPVMLTAEERLSAGIVVLGGLTGDARPEASEVNYVTRVKIPTLMLNGKYDMTFPFDTTVKPMFDLLGTPAENKRLKVYDTDHFIPRNEYMKETLAWLDRYLGPVK
jgi:dienelactone hydrolase/tRNA A-37 threonylcarbamoyl transferase component Bud32